MKEYMYDMLLELLLCNDNMNYFVMIRRIVFLEEGSFFLFLSCVKYFERFLKLLFVSLILVCLVCF